MILYRVILFCAQGDRYNVHFLSASICGSRVSLSLPLLAAVLSSVFAAARQSLSTGGIHMTLAPHMDCLQHDEDDSLCEKKVLTKVQKWGLIELRLAMANH